MIITVVRNHVVLEPVSQEMNWNASYAFTCLWICFAALLTIWYINTSLSNEVFDDYAA